MGASDVLRLKFKGRAKRWSCLEVSQAWPGKPKRELRMSGWVVNRMLYFSASQISLRRMNHGVMGPL
jgi:hypothetical protein